MNFPKLLKQVSRVALKIVTGVLLIANFASAAESAGDAQAQARVLLNAPVALRSSMGTKTALAPAGRGASSMADPQRQARDLLAAGPSVASQSGLRLSTDPTGHASRSGGTSKHKHADAQEAARRMILGKSQLSESPSPPLAARQVRWLPAQPC